MALLSTILHPVGLDASTLDNLDSTQFIRSDAADIKTAGDLTFNDNIKLHCGTGNDFTFYHVGDNSYVQNNTGNITVDESANSGLILLRSFNSVGVTKTGIAIGGATPEVILNYDGIEKLKTTSAGITVTGTLNATTNLTVSGTSVSLTSHDHTLDALSNTTITANSTGEILKWSGTAWINNTLAEAGISATTHNHTGVYEPADATILKDADIGVTVQAYDVDTAKLDVVQSFTAEQTFKEIAETVYNLTGTVIDPANGTIQWKILSANTTFTESLTTGQALTLSIDDGTAYTITWPTITWIGGVAPVLPTTGWKVVTIWKTGATLYGQDRGNA